MAERRMFSKSVVESDAFLQLPLSSQALYFHLGMEADDDGFVNNPISIFRKVGANDDDLRILLAKEFLFPRDNGVVLVKHWKINNYLRRDRYKQSIYQAELLSSFTEDSTGAYIPLNRSLESKS